MIQAEIQELFDKHNEEYIKFERIPVENRRHPRPDICALIYLHERFGGNGDAVMAAEHDEIYLDWKPEEIDLTEEDIIYINRCGVRYASNYDCFAMFV